MKELLFYTTVGCHLCEQAEELLEQLARECDLALTAVDISSDEQLVEQYGVRIPVVKHPGTGGELGWPFGLADLRDLLSAEVGPGRA